MRLPFLVACIFSTSTHLVGAEPFSPSKSDPPLKLKKIVIPQERSQPLQITVEFAAKGTGPVAISQKQLSLHISTPNQPYLFVSDLVFPNDSPSTFTVAPGSPLTIVVQSSQNQFGDRGTWGTLLPGKYSARIYINSGKSQEFDFHWLGQTYSDNYELDIK